MQAARRPSALSWLGRFPSALGASALLLFATPVLGGGPAAQQLLAATDTVVAGAQLEPAIDIGASAGPIRALPDTRLVPPPSSLLGYRWPIHNARITQPYGDSPVGSGIVDGRPFHDGIDLATFCGDRITAAHDGTVLAAGRHYDEFMGWVGDLTDYTARLDEKHLWQSLPNVVVIDDGNGYRSLYAHFEALAVKPGEVVKAGDLLGWEGATGRATGCHLHFGLFSPDTLRTFGYDPVAAAHMRLPAVELARTDPLLVLPPLSAAHIR